MFFIMKKKKELTRVNKATLALNVSLCVTAITEVDVIKGPERVTMGYVPMDGVEQIVSKVWSPAWSIGTLVPCERELHWYPVNESNINWNW